MTGTETPELTGNENFRRAKSYASKVRQNHLNFSSEHLSTAENAYVAWVDLMGSGHIMGTSVHKSANFLVRLHMAVERSRTAINFNGRIVAINDGVFIVSKDKRAIVSMVGRIFILLAGNFIAVPRPHDRFLVRGGVAFGPVYSGNDLRAGLRPKRLQQNSAFLEPVLFGAPIIQAYRSEGAAPPYGIAIHESARSFAPAGEQPFRMTHWLWWAPNEATDYPPDLPPLSEYKDCLAAELESHFNWLKSTAIFSGLETAKISIWHSQCNQYFSLA